MAIIMGVVLMMVISTAVAIGLSGVRSSKTNEDWNAALAAAYAGVEEYRNRLANDSTYTKFGNPVSDFSSTSNVSVDSNNPAFGMGPSGSWATVPGSGGAATFRYEVDNSKYSAKGVLSLRSTGRVGDSTRTVVADLRQSGFIDFLYFTDYEVRDPDLGGRSCTVRYQWQGSVSCDTIQFASGDTMNGPMHSNDTLRLCGTFNGEVTTGDPGTSGSNYIASCSNPRFNYGKPKSGQTIGMPETNSEMKKEVRTDLGDDVPQPGCLYTGPTSIVLNGDGTMTVHSPFTKFTRVAGDGATSGTKPSECGTPGTDSNQLGSSGGAKINVLDENLVYVQNVPSVSSNKNYTRNGSWPDGFTCKSGGSGWTLGSLAYPMADEKVPSLDPAHYGCRNGDAFVKGTLSGAMTIASENYLYVTGDIKYKDAGSDILGLVGNTAVFVWNPYTCTSWNTDWRGNRTTCRSYGFTMAKNRTISAAILSVAHSFTVQNYDVGSSRGTLTVKGAIAQKFRGPVATTGNTGYDKDYNYDDRLRYTAPPKFLSPVSTTYGISKVGSVGSAFNADGSTR
ncbi:hypothetical protein [Paramicrobacterium humi]|nr:hypothetical protein [Microbacterium humi]